MTIPLSWFQMNQWLFHTKRAEKAPQEVTNTGDEQSTKAPFCLPIIYGQTLKQNAYLHMWRYGDSLTKLSLRNILVFFHPSRVLKMIYFLLQSFLGKWGELT